MSTFEKVAYLKGLIEGMEIDTQSGKGKLFSVIADIFEDLSSDIAGVEKNVCDLPKRLTH